MAHEPIDLGLGLEHVAELSPRARAILEGLEAKWRGEEESKASQSASQLRAQHPAPQTQLLITDVLLVLVEKAARGAHVLDVHASGELLERDDCIFRDLVVLNVDQGTDSRQFLELQRPAVLWSALLQSLDKRPPILDAAEVQVEALLLQEDAEWEGGEGEGLDEAGPARVLEQSPLPQRRFLALLFLLFDMLLAADREAGAAALLETMLWRLLPRGDPLDDPWRRPLCLALAARFAIGCGHSALMCDLKIQLGRAVAVPEALLAQCARPSFLPSVAALCTRLGLPVPPPRPAPLVAKAPPHAHSRSRSLPIASSSSSPPRRVRLAPPAMEDAEPAPAPASGRRQGDPNPNPNPNPNPPASGRRQGGAPGHAGALDEAALAALFKLCLVEEEGGGEGALADTKSLGRYLRRLGRSALGRAGRLAVMLSRARRRHVCWARLLLLLEEADALSQTEVLEHAFGEKAAGEGEEEEGEEGDGYEFEELDMERLDLGAGELRGGGEQLEGVERVGVERGGVDRVGEDLAGVAGEAQGETGGLAATAGDGEESYVDDFQTDDLPSEAETPPLSLPLERALAGAPHINDFSSLPLALAEPTPAPAPSLPPLKPVKEPPMPAQHDPVIAPATPSLSAVFTSVDLGPPPAPQAFVAPPPAKASLPARTPAPTPPQPVNVAIAITTTTTMITTMTTARVTERIPSAAPPPQAPASLSISSAMAEVEPRPRTDGTGLALRLRGEAVRAGQRDAAFTPKEASAARVQAQREREDRAARDRTALRAALGRAQGRGSMSAAATIPAPALGLDSFAQSARVMHAAAVDRLSSRGLWVGRHLVLQRDRDGKPQLSLFARCVPSAWGSLPAAPKGLVPLGCVAAVAVDSSPGARGRQFSLRLRSGEAAPPEGLLAPLDAALQGKPQREWVFRCALPEERMVWVQVIEAAKHLLQE